MNDVNAIPEHMVRGIDPQVIADNINGLWVVGTRASGTSQQWATIEPAVFSNECGGFWHEANCNGMFWASDAMPLTDAIILCEQENNRE